MISDRHIACHCQNWRTEQSKFPAKLNRVPSFGLLWCKIDLDEETLQKIAINSEILQLLIRRILHLRRRRRPLLRTPAAASAPSRPRPKDRPRSRSRGRSTSRPHFRRIFLCCCFTVNSHFSSSRNHLFALIRISR